MDREQFARHVREALAHLYDPVFLREHPLRASLAPEGEPISGEGLQQILAEAIQQLKSVSVWGMLQL